jgi:hypothetical protein
LLLLPAREKTGVRPRHRKTHRRYSIRPHFARRKAIIAFAVFPKLQPLENPKSQPEKNKENDEQTEHFFRHCGNAGCDDYVLKTDYYHFQKNQWLNRERQKNYATDYSKI